MNQQSIDRSTENHSFHVMLSPRNCSPNRKRLKASKAPVPSLKARLIRSRIRGSFGWPSIHSASASSNASSTFLLQNFSTWEVIIVIPWVKKGIHSGLKLHEIDAFILKKKTSFQRARKWVSGASWQTSEWPSTLSVNSWIIRLTVLLSETNNNFLSSPFLVSSFQSHPAPNDQKAWNLSKSSAARISRESCRFWTPCHGPRRKRDSQLKTLVNPDKTAPSSSIYPNFVPAIFRRAFARPRLLISWWRWSSQAASPKTLDDCCRLDQSDKR